jgi:glycosyltransferase involved in cell wall biosynthesis
MTRDCPLVSICLPVYNGETYGPEAIRSILDQTFEDFELIISDNASTDATPDICRDVVARDARVRYYRADANRGLAWNHNRAFELARGRYLAWIGHDDLMGREYISQCIKALKDDSGAVLSFAMSSHIDDKGNVIERFPTQNSGATERPSRRFHDILRDDWCHPIYGLMKTEVLKQTRLHGGFADSDRVLLAEMGLRGRFTQVPQYLFSRRVHPHGTTRKYRSVRERTLIFDPAKTGKIFSPVFLESRALFSAIRLATLPLKERFSCYRSLLRWLWNEHRRHLLDELCERALFTLTKLFIGRPHPATQDAEARLLKTCFR